MPRNINEIVLSWIRLLFYIEEKIGIIFSDGELAAGPVLPDAGDPLPPPPQPTRQVLRLHGVTALHINTSKQGRNLTSTDE